MRLRHPPGQRLAERKARGQKQGADWFRRKPLQARLNSQDSPGSSEKSALFFWTGRGPFSFRQDEKKMGGGSRPLAGDRAKAIAPGGAKLPLVPWQGLSKSPAPAGAKYPPAGIRQSPAARPKKKCSRPTANAMGREHRTSYTSWCHPPSPRNFLEKGRSLPGPLCAGGRPGRFRPRSQTVFPCSARTACSRGRCSLDGRGTRVLLSGHSAIILILYVVLREMSRLGTLISASGSCC